MKNVSNLIQKIFHGKSEKREIYSSFARSPRPLAQTDVQTRRFISLKERRTRRASVTAGVSPTSPVSKKVDVDLGRPRQRRRSRSYCEEKVSKDDACVVDVTANE